MELLTAIEIAAPAQRVWDVLTDFPAYPQWNPFVRRIAGEAKVGARLEVVIAPPGMGNGMTLRPRVLIATPEREFRWLGQLWLPGLFDGEHRFVITPLGEGRTGFEQGEVFRGVLAPVVMWSIRAATLRGFQAMNQALKERAEAGA